jgi:hypothetical protein
VTSALLPGRRLVRLTDAVAVAVVLVAVALGLLTGLQLDRITDLGTSLQAAASALDRTGSALGTVAGLPVVGGQIGGVADSVRATAEEVRRGGAQAVGTVHVLAVLIGLVVAFVPLPALALYLPFRLRRGRALRELRSALDAPGGPDPALLAQLAHRALLCVPPARLHAVTPDPWADLMAGRHGQLAAAELERLGLPAGSATRSSSRRA